MEAQRGLDYVICDSLVLSVLLPFHLFLHLPPQKKYLIFNVLVQISSTASELSSSTYWILLPSSSISILLWVSPWAKEHSGAELHMHYRHRAFFQSLAVIRGEHSISLKNGKLKSIFKPYFFCNNNSVVYGAALGCGLGELW